MEGPIDRWFAAACPPKPAPGGLPVPGTPVRLTSDHSIAPAAGVTILMVIFSDAGLGQRDSPNKGSGLSETDDVQLQSIGMSTPLGNASSISPRLAIGQMSMLMNLLSGTYQHHRRIGRRRVDIAYIGTISVHPAPGRIGRCRIQSGQFKEEVQVIVASPHHIHFPALLRYRCCNHTSHKNACR